MTHPGKVLGSQGSVPATRTRSAAKISGLIGCALLFLPLSGCGGNSLPRTPYAGVQVCFDENENLICDPGEPSAQADGNGHFHLSGFASGEVLLVASVQPESVSLLDGRSPGTGFPLVRLGPENSDISVFSTLAWALVASGMASQNDSPGLVREALSLPGADEPGGNVEQVTLELYRQYYAAGATTAAASLRARDAAVAVFQKAGQILDTVGDYHPSEDIPDNSGSDQDGRDPFLADCDSFPLRTSMRYGTGLDSSNFAPKGYCLATTASVPGLCQNTVDYGFELTSSASDIGKHMEWGLGVSARLSLFGFSAAGVGGSYNFLSDQQTQDRALFVIIRHQTILCGYPVEAHLRPDMESAYSGSYDGFRDSCGDLFLYNITTGGYFIGAIKVTLNAQQSVQNERLRLYGELLGFTVWDKTWQAKMAKVMQNYHTESRVISNFFEYKNDPYVNNLPGMFKVYNEKFLARIQGPQCQGKLAWRDCGYRASFADYRTITAAPRGENKDAAYLSNQISWENFIRDADVLINYLEEITSNPKDYNIGKDVDALSSENDWTPAILKSKLDELKDKRGQAVDNWMNCYYSLNDCNNNSKDLAFSDQPLYKSFLDMKRALPTKKFVLSQDCRDVSANKNKFQDGNNPLYLGHLFEGYYDANCRNMATDKPITYLILGQKSYYLDKPGDNFISLARGSELYGKVFDEIPVNPRTEPSSGHVFLEVIDFPEDFCGIPSTKLPCRISQADEQVYKALVGYGALTVHADQGGQATANLNLEGTEMHIREGLLFSLNGKSDSYQYTVEPTYQILNDQKSVLKKLVLTLKPKPGLDLSLDNEGATVMPVGPILLEHD